METKVTKFYEDHKAACVIVAGIIGGVVSASIGVKYYFKIREIYKDFNERRETMSYLFCFNPSSHLLAMQMENGGILC